MLIGATQYTCVKFLPEAETQYVLSPFSGSLFAARLAGLSSFEDLQTFCYIDAHP